MESIKKLVRENILQLKPYQSARSIFKQKGSCLMDANENPYGEYGRYPDSSQDKLKSRLTELKALSTDQVFLGNGSDEIIDLLIRTFCVPAKDSIICLKPGFGMYAVCARINDVNCISLNLNEKYDLDQSIVDQCLDSGAKILFLCSPNNPTGNALDEYYVNKLIDSFNGIVVIDEAYVDFNQRTTSFINRLGNNPRLVILQTFSKGMGMAGLRIGALYGHMYVIQLLNKVKPPYNISSANQRQALEILQNPKKLKEDIQKILKEKERLQKFFDERYPDIETVPSDSNFILFKCEDSDSVYQKLREAGIIIRNQSYQIPNALRISIGQPEENQLFMKTFKKIYNAESIVSR